MKLGILGGSFNPVHKGHLHLAEKAIEEQNLDRVVFVPAYISPFKTDRHETADNTEERIKTLAAAIAGDPRFAIDDCEIRREGVSYTVDTLEDIIERYIPDGKLYLLIGDDLAADFTKWRNYERILEIAEVVVGKREQLTMHNAQCTMHNYSYPHILLHNEIMDISSSMIRQIMKEGKDYSSYILSSSSAPLRLCARGSVTEIEKTAMKTLSIMRFLHSRHTALLAHDMCKRFGIEPMDGYLVGIAHDLAKQYDPKELLKLAKKDGFPISALEKEKPGLLHGRAAAVLLKERFSIHNEDILEAVRVHTTGTPDMGSLAKIIYIADKVEVSRSGDSQKTLDNITNLRKMCFENDLDKILYEVLKKFADKLQLKGQTLTPDSKKLLKKMKGMFG